MSNINHQFFCFPTEVITSGIWGRLSNPARSLYPTLLRFSDSTYKPVWPGTELLLNLTGFRSKKSLQIARNELKTVGLIDYIPGTGRTSTRYFFCPAYHPGADSHTPQREAHESHRGESSNTPAGYPKSAGAGTDVPPNHINITITNNQNNEQPTAKQTYPSEKAEMSKNNSIKYDKKQINTKQDKAVWTGLNSDRRSSLGLVSELEQEWNALGNVLEATATENTIDQFKTLRPCELENGAVMIFGQCSSHLKRLLEAKFPSIQFESEAIEH